MMPQKQIVLLMVIVAALLLGQISGAMAAPPSQGEDLAVIFSPASNAVVRDTVEIVGSADYPSFQFYIIEVSPEPVGDQWQIVGQIHDQPVINGVLENWNTTAVPDGSYTLRLRVVRLDGNYSEAFTQQIVVSNAAPLPTDTPIPAPVVEELLVPAEVAPTITPTDLPPTPTIVIDQPVVETPTPRPIATTPPLEDPDEEKSLIPAVSGFSLTPIMDACLYGSAAMLILFLSFGFLSAMRYFILQIIERRRGR
jgi:hypothetical protein